QNNRGSLSPAVVLPDGSTLTALASSDATASTGNVEGPVVDVTQYDSTSLLCNRVADGVFQGKVPLILRGECNFTVKLHNAYLSGATTAIVYNSPTNATPNALITMSVSDDPSIPGLFIGYDDGAALKQSVAAATQESPYQVQVRFSVSGDPNQLSSFSSLGPSIDYAVKPDLVATGGSVYTAGETDYPTGGMYTSTGYVTVSGTSFSAPMVAGAAAVLKASRPGLYAQDYRSLLVNSARPLTAEDGTTMDVMKGGAGSLNLENALKLTLSAFPVSVSFGLQGSTLDTYRQVIVRNVTDATRSYTLELQTANTVRPLLTASTLTLAPGEIAGPCLIFQGEFTPGNYQGFLVMRDDQTQAETRVPYWLAVKTGKPTQVSIPIYPESFRAGSTVSYYFRLHDVSGAIVEDVTPEVTATNGNSIVRRVGQYSGYPGLWYLDISVGTMSSSVEIVAGDAKRTITITPE
ncbi:MAG TPA: S8 family serine peptidase, partial [Bryobacteraceae bacterium]|nr:S8 family serine peptidase [Bryobacteraceae bacterium]